MIKFIRQLSCYALLVSALANVAHVQAQDRVTVDRAIRFQRGKNFSIVRGRIARGTSHVFRVQARAGQQMAVVIKTGNRTSFTVTARGAGILEGADGVREAIVELPETGEYAIQIGTDAGANYTLEITIK